MGVSSCVDTCFFAGVGHYDNVCSPQIIRNLGEVQSLYTCADNGFALTGQFLAGVCSFSSLVLTFLGSGEVYAWGNNEYGQLGVASTVPQVLKERRRRG